MTARDPQERAKSSDRDAAIDLIEQAHADGRLGSADRTIRKNNVATAATLGELEMITRDLVGPGSAATDTETDGGPTASAGERIETAVETQYEVPPQAWRPRSAPVYRSGCGVPALVLLVLALVGVAVAGSAFLTTVGLPEIDLGELEPQPTAQVEDEYAMDEAGIAWVLDRYEATFETTAAWRTVFYDSYVTFEVPGGSGTHVNWIYRNGTFDGMGPVQVKTPGDSAVNLDRIDLAALERSLTRARATLGVSDASVSHVIVADDPFVGRPTVTVYVTNTLGQSGFLVTDLRGKLLRSFGVDN